MKKYWKYYLIAVGVIVLDQVSKLWIHRHLEFGGAEQISFLGGWLRILYTLNPGMAFGVKFGFKYGKLFLTTFRIVASGVIAWYIKEAVRKPAFRNSFFSAILGWSFILGGAIGNLIDSIFYGVFLDNAPYDAPMKWFHGQVIDMIFVATDKIYLPEWFPFIGGQFLPPYPVFNIADSFICIGAGWIFLIAFLQDRKMKRKTQ